LQTNRNIFSQIQSLLVAAFSLTLIIVFKPCCCSSVTRGMPDHNYGFSKTANSFYRGDRNRQPQSILSTRYCFAWSTVMRVFYLRMGNRSVWPKTLRRITTKPYLSMSFCGKLRRKEPQNLKRPKLADCSLQTDCFCVRSPLVFNYSSLESRSCTDLVNTKHLGTSHLNILLSLMP